MDKKTLRRQILGIRNGLDDNDREYLNGRLTLRVLSLERIRNADTVMCYASYGSEADTLGIITKLWNSGKRVAVPRVSGDDMDFFLIEKKEDLISGYKGIPEPDEGCELYVPGNNDVVLVPGAVFDKRLFRIGYGRGFYDRYLSRYKNLYSIGMCFDFQIVDEVPVDPWDRGLDMIVTQQRLYLPE